jgi:hypothetical protein
VVGRHNGSVMPLEAGQRHEFLVVGDRLGRDRDRVRIAEQQIAESSRNWQTDGRPARDVTPLTARVPRE